MKVVESAGDRAGGRGKGRKGCLPLAMLICGFADFERVANAPSVFGVSVGRYFGGKEKILNAENTHPPRKVEASFEYLGEVASEEKTAC